MAAQEVSGKLKRILVNVAWPYANGALHVGHVAGSLLGPDIFSRYHRLRGNEVIMVSGSDQHGTAVSIRAEKEGKTPEEVAEKYHRINKESIEWLGIKFDIFTKTHTENHIKVSQEFFLDLYRKGFLYPKSTNQYYCTTDSRFLADTYVVGTCPKCGYTEAKGNQCEVCRSTFEPGELIHPRCTICSNPTVLRESTQLFFALSKFSDPLQAYLRSVHGWRQNVIDFSLNWIESGLDDRSATRDLDWGVPVPLPEYSGKVIYVWMEAVIGYLSATIELFSRTGNPDGWKRYWQEEKTEHYYFMGKDNIPFHTIIWPAMLIAHGSLRLPFNVVANEYLMPGNSKLKFSKSRGGAPEIRELGRHFKPEHIRYYLTSVMPEGRDSTFSLEDMVAKINNELVATLGNYYHRVLSFSYKNFGSLSCPAEGIDLQPAISDSSVAAASVSSHIEACEFKKALKSIIDLAQRGNQFFDRCAPWATIKNSREKCSADMFNNLELVRRLAIMSSPFLPYSSEKIMHFLGLSPEEQLKWDMLDSTPSSFTLNEPAPVFERIDARSIPGVLEGSAEKDSVLDMRVGLILSVRKHPSADKLYLLELDIGERRQIVAGLRPYYTEEQLTGKKVVVLANLATANLRGYQSQGMILAAENGDSVKFLTPASDVPVGPLDCSRGISAGTITIDEFRKADLRIACLSRGELRLSGECPPDSSEIAVMVGADGIVPLKKDDVAITVDGGKIGPGSRIR
ncbi:MAG: methionine--tRNA ligase [Candidatus Thermoplasmatota archaeon]|nr:methionine--tRNA ligase [Candidatus Thermoplasmatota archaeon]